MENKIAKEFVEIKVESEKRQKASYSIALKRESRTKPYFPIN